MISKSPFKKAGPSRCWKGFKPVKGKDAYEEGSCAPAKKSCGPKKGTKGGGTRKVCLPKAKIASMSASERQAVVSAKQSAASKGKYKRSSRSNVSGTASKNLRDWVKQDWRQVGDPSKKCGE
tara:strand:- start:1146 stop:1511 length:366 start_codon:yes stop_codon:yes gene_type:complete